MPDLAALRARFRALPLDRAPLRRAGVLTALLVVLLVAGKALSPSQSAATATAGRNSVQAVAEKDAARGGWTGGRVLAVLLLAAGAGGAWVLHRRAAPTATRSSALDVLETHTLAPGQTLRLVACGDDVMLLSATPEAIRMLRHWPREQFDRGESSFAALLASAETNDAPHTLPLADAVAEPPAAEIDIEAWISERSDRTNGETTDEPASQDSADPDPTPQTAPGPSTGPHRSPPLVPSWPDAEPLSQAARLPGTYQSRQDAPENAAPESAAPALTSLQRLQARRSTSVAPDLPAAPGALRQFQPADV